MRFRADDTEKKSDTLGINLALPEPASGMTNQATSISPTPESASASERAQGALMRFGTPGSGTNAMMREQGRTAPVSPRQHLTHVEMSVGRT